MKKAFITLIALLMIPSLFACSLINGGKSETALPNTPAPETAGPTESADNNTPAPEAELVFTNELKTSIIGFYISSSDDFQWNGQLNEYSIPAGESITVPFQNFNGVNGGVYDIGTHDENGINYDAIEVVLRHGDRVTLSSDENEARFTVLHADGTNDAYIAEMRESDPDGDKVDDPFIVGKTSVYDYEFDEATYRTLAYLDYSELMLSGIDLLYFPKLITALDQSNAQRRESANAVYEKLVKEGTATDDRAPGIVDEVYLRRCDFKVLSALYVRTIDTGESVKTVFSADNFDKESGQKLMLCDVADITLIPELINAQLEKNGEDGFILDPDIDYTDRFSSPCDDFAWTLDYNGITFRFNAGAFGSELDHTVGVMLSFRDNSDLVKAQYAKAEKNYAVYMPLDFDTFLDIGGKTARVSITGEEAENLDIGVDIGITIDGKLFEDRIDAFDIEPVYIRANGRDYIHMHCGEFNDRSFITVYEITNGNVKRLGETYNAWHFEYSVEEEKGVSALIVDPMDFMLDTYTELLSTARGVRSYAIGEDGMPFTAEELCMLSGSIELKLRCDITAVRLDMFGMPTGETETLKAGAALIYIRTDDKKTADFLTADGGLFRIEVNITDYTRTVEGKPIEEVFDGIIFAG